MSPITHLLASCKVASIPKLESRDRTIITLVCDHPLFNNDNRLFCLEKRALAP